MCSKGMKSLVAQYDWRPLREDHEGIRRAMGSDAAIEAADVVLMDDDPLQIANAILLSRKCLRIVYENIVFALGIKFLCLGLGAVGIANMWFAIFADVGVMILAILNAIRALYAPSVSIKKDSRKMVLQPQSE